MLELFDCIPLAAKITKATCEANQRRGNSGCKGGQLKIFACESCPGVGGSPQVVTVTEEDGMAKGPCKEPGCRKHQVVGGFCTEHADLRCPEKMDAKRRRSREIKGLPPEPIKYVRGAVPATPAPVTDPVVSPTVMEVSETFGQVVNAAGEGAPFGVSPLVLEATRALLRGVEHRMLVELSGLPDDTAVLLMADTFYQVTTRMERRPAA